MRSAPFAILFSDNLLQSKNIDYLCNEKDCENFNFLKITMKKVKLSLFALVAMMAASCVADPVMEGEGVAADKSPIAKIINSSDDAAAGKLILYVDEETADAWSINTTRSGNAQLDAVADELGVESIAPVFNMNINGEEKRAQGMHRWYVVKFDEAADVQSVAVKFAEISSIQRVQYSTVLSRPQVKASPLAETEIAETRAVDHPFDDPKLPMQWHYNNRGLSETIFAGAKEGEDIGAYGAWKYTTGNREVVVAVVDEGVKYDHPDLADNMWVNQAELAGTVGVDDDGNGYVDDIHGLNAVKLNGNITWNRGDWAYNEKGQKYWDGDSGHGTHVAGTVAAVNNNGIGVAGVAGGNGSGNGVRIMSIQVFDGNDATSLDSNARGIEYAADNGASILQNSWGYNDDRITSDNAYSSSSSVELAALRYFVSKSNCAAMNGGVVIFAAGNEGLPHARYPGAFNEFVCVTAYAPDGAPATYTCYDKGCNVAAPGGEYELLKGAWSDNGSVLSTLPAETIDYATGAPYGSDYGYMQGTSMACPHVSGVAALVLSYALDNGIKLTNTQLYDILTSSVRNFDDFLTGSVTRHYGDKRAYSFYIDGYKGKMGTGKLDATLAIMNLRGATCVPTTVGEEYAFKLGEFIGTGDINITMMRDYVVEEDVKARLGMTLDYFNNTIYIKCTKPGIGVITVKYIAGGNAVGGGSTSGGKLMEKEVVIISRENNDNGGWL